MPHPSPATFKENEREKDKNLLRPLAECVIGLIDRGALGHEKSYELILRVHDNKLMEINRRSTTRLF